MINVAKQFQLDPKEGNRSSSVEQTSSFRIAYICFDVVPAPKGAAIHIEAFARALATLPGTLDLVTVSPTGEILEHPTDWLDVRHIALPAVGKTLIDRVLNFRRHLWQWLQDKQCFDVIHIRSIYEGLPIALNKDLVCRQLFFEVNGLPSIELKYRYPRVMDDHDLMTKIIAQEEFCLAQSDRIITPSSVTRNYLVQRGAPEHIIHVIQNGVDLTTFTYKAPCSDSDDREETERTPPPFKLLYVGTLSAWQGVELAIEALALYRRDFPATLTIIGPTRGKQDNVLMDLAAKLGVAEQVTILPPMPQRELVKHMHKASAIAAPLKPNDRNLVQGCCPLKVLEAMASGTPVITSDLPVIRDLGENNVHFLAVRPGSAKAIKDAMLQLSGRNSLAQDLAMQAHHQVQASFSWSHAQHHLRSVYISLKK